MYILRKCIEDSIFIINILRIYLLIYIKILRIYNKI